MSLITFFNVTDSAPTWVYLVVIAALLFLLTLVLLYVRLFIWKRGRGTNEEDPTIELTTFTHTTTGRIEFAIPHGITANTQIGHGDGYCWVQLFKPNRRSALKTQLGPFPSLALIAALPVDCRSTRDRGHLHLFGATAAHFERDTNGTRIWPYIDAVVDNNFQYNLLVDSNRTSIISRSIPAGYLYGILFKPEHRGLLTAALGEAPTVRAVVEIDPTFRADPAGRIMIRNLKAHIITNPDVRGRLWDDIITRVYPTRPNFRLHT